MFQESVCCHFNPYCWTLLFKMSRMNRKGVDNMQVQVHRSFQARYLLWTEQCKTSILQKKRRPYNYCFSSGEIYMRPPHKGGRCMLIVTQPPSFRAQASVCLRQKRRHICHFDITPHNGHWQPTNLRMFYWGFLWNALLKFRCACDTVVCQLYCQGAQWRTRLAHHYASNPWFWWSAFLQLQATQQLFDWFTGSATKHKQTDWPSDGVLNSKWIGLVWEGYAVNTAASRMSLRQKLFLVCESLPNQWVLRSNLDGDCHPWNLKGRECKRDMPKIFETYAYTATIPLPFISVSIVPTRHKS